MLEVEIDTRKLDKAFLLAPRLLKQELGDAFDHISLSFLKSFRKERLQGPPGVYGDGRKGLLGTFQRASLVSQSLQGMGIEIFSNSKIAKRLEVGGTVYPSGSGRLAVPIRGNAKNRAIMYTKGMKLKKQYKDPASLKRTFRIKGNGKEFIAKRIAGETRLLYVLKSSVKNEEMLGFFDTWNNTGFQNKRIQLLNKAVDKAIARI
jgi:hypothetical protein